MEDDALCSDVNGSSDVVLGDGPSVACSRSSVQPAQCWGIQAWARTTPTSDTKRVEAAQVLGRAAPGMSSGRPSPRSRAAFGEWAGPPSQCDPGGACCTAGCAGAAASTPTPSHEGAALGTPQLEDTVVFELHADADGAAAGDGGSEDDSDSRTDLPTPWIHLYTRASSSRISGSSWTPMTQHFRLTTEQSSDGSRYRPVLVGVNNTQGRRQGATMVPAHYGVAGNAASNLARGAGAPGIRSRNGHPLPAGWEVVLQPNVGRRRAGYRRSKSATKTLLGSGSTGAGPKCRSGWLPVVNSMQTRSRHHHHLQRPALHTISTHLGGRLCPPLPPRHQPGLCHLPLLVAAQPHIAASSISRRSIANGYALQACNVRRR